MEHRNKKDDSILVLVPAGKFIMGSNDRHDEKPPHEVYLDDYYIGKYEVTNEQFARFVGESGYSAEGKWRDYAKSGRESHPVVNVTWNDAVEYCRWAGLRLPSEAEWEKAARGTDGRKYPWGNDWDKNLCNNWDMDRSDLVASRADMSNGRGTMPVGMFPEGASPFDVLDMAGNAEEWCSSLYRPYPYNTDDGRENGSTVGARVVRGRSWNYYCDFNFRCAFHLSYEPDFYYNFFGFRVAFGERVVMQRHLDLTRFLKHQKKEI